MVSNLQAGYQSNRTITKKLKDISVSIGNENITINKNYIDSIYVKKIKTKILKGSKIGLIYGVIIDISLIALAAIDLAYWGGNYGTKN